MFSQMRRCPNPLSLQGMKVPSVEAVPLLRLAAGMGAPVLVEPAESVPGVHSGRLVRLK